MFAMSVWWLGFAYFHLQMICQLHDKGRTGYRSLSNACLLFKLSQWPLGEGDQGMAANTECHSWASVIPLGKSRKLSCLAPNVN